MSYDEKRIVLDMNSDFLLLFYIVGISYLYPVLPCFYPRPPLIVGQMYRRLIIFWFQVRI